MVSSFQKPDSQDDPKGFQNTMTKTPAKEISQLVTDLVQQSAFSELISSSDIWWSSHAHCLSCEGRRPAVPSGGRGASRHFASQQPMFTLPLSFLPLQQQFSSIQIIHQGFSFRALLVCLSSAYFISILQEFSIPLTFHHSGAHC